AAPGASIRSTINGNKYANKSGTSMAAPYVAGVAAAIWSLRPALSYREVILLLYSTSIQGSSFNNKLATSGHIDRVKALSPAANLVHDPADERHSDLGPTVCSP